MRVLYGSLLLAAAAAHSGCLCPPCPGEGPSQPPEVLASGSRLGIGDGATGGVGANGKSWADCDKKPDCKVTLEVKRGVGRNGSIGLQYSAKGPAWNGGGWNWFGWWPETSGTDIRAYGNLVFWVRLEAKSPE